jgi:hypothetical protein
MYENLWENEDSVTDLGISIPEWMDDVSPYDMTAIYEGGCASGAYMPAVTYHTANAVMAEHGDDVLDYLSAELGSIPAPPDDSSWAGMAVFFLSYAVEVWVSHTIDEVAEALENETETAED